MKLSEIIGPAILGYLKFTDYSDSLLQGELYMNNLKCYIDMEQQQGNRGMGDKLEASQVLTNVDLEFRNPETDELLFIGNAKEINMRIDGDDSKPVYCMLALTSDDFEFISTDGNQNRFKLNFSQDTINHMIEEFGENLVFMQAKILDRIHEVCTTEGYNFMAGLVAYDDYQINHSRRISSYYERSNEVFFWKDIYFKNQKEFRIVILDDDVETPFKLQLGNIEDIATKYNAREFFGNGGFELNISQNVLDELNVQRGEK